MVQAVTILMMKSACVEAAGKVKQDVYPWPRMYVYTPSMSVKKGIDSA